MKGPGRGPRSRSGAAARGRRRGRTRAGIALALAVLAGARPAQATEIRFRGLLDLVVSERGPAFDHNLLTRGDSHFDPYGLRIFADARVREGLAVYSQVMLRDATPPYVDGAYLQYTPWPAHDVHLQAGKIPWPIGSFGPRTYSNRNPLVSPPLMYHYHSSLVWYEVVPSADVLLAAAGTGQFGIDYFGYPEGRGMPIVDDCYWDVGATLTGSRRPLEYSIGVIAGTPGWGSTSQDENTGKSVLGRIGFVPIPALRVGVSGSHGPYLHRKLNPLLPPGREAEEFDQQLLMADLELAIGHLELRAEGARNVWETPTVGDLRATSGYLELEHALPFGAFLAGRWDLLRYGDLVGSDGLARPWDHPLTRIEAGAGYRISREARAKLVVQRTAIERGAGVERRHTLVAAQLSLGF